MVNVVIIDDEINARSLLANLLIQELGSRLHIVDSCPSVFRGVQAIKSNKVDLVFLDIQMPEEDGFELMKYFDEIDFEVIFVTAYDRYAIQAFECSALHYLLKPINPDKIKQAISRFLNRIENKKAIHQKLAVLAEYLESKKENERLVFQTETGFEVISLKQILYVSASGNYCQIHLKSQNCKLVTKSMKGIEDCLPSKSFCRIHNSTIVNMNEILSFSNADREVKMVDGKELKVAERRLNVFKNRVSEMA